ncbi:MAG: PfkB family carbohydrate kinase [Thermodesulfobacteriota bacterium]
MKVLPLQQLQQEVERLRKQGKRITLCHGVFDLLHIGHIRYLRQASKFGDVLVVTVTPDRFVDKGPTRPAFPEELRAEGIAALDCVDFVAINQWPTAEETLRLIRPDFYVKGSEFRQLASDMTGKIGREAEVVREVGAELVFTDDIVFSSSNLINRYLSVFPKETREYLDIFRGRYTLDGIMAFLDRMESLRVLVIGDAILDEYQYCNPLGISSKDPALALHYQHKDLFAGGVMAVANHVGSFAGQVDLVTVLGSRQRHEKFIRSQLVESISPHFFNKTNSPTTTKRRFLDGYSLTKLFEVYEMDDSGLSQTEDQRLCDWLLEHLPRYDLVLAADFGHGAISEQVVEILVKHAPFLCVNTQANAGNRGFHTIRRYPRADFVCLAGHEVQLAVGKKKANMKIAIGELAKRLGCRKFVITMGRRGCLVWESGNVVQIPAFAQDVVDRVGAGDTLFSIASLAARLDAAPECLGFLGNVVGAEAVRVIGNQKHIEKLGVKKHITALLK